MLAFGNDTGMKALVLHMVHGRSTVILADCINSFYITSLFPVAKVTFLANVSSTSVLSLARERVLLSLVKQVLEEDIA